ncbi:MAG: tyrosine-type recombinase/integrase, partial [Myxococcota bacterium]
ILPLVAPLKAALDAQRRWLSETGHEGQSSDLVFPSSPNQALAGARRRQTDELSWYRARSCLYKPLERVCEEAGVPPLSPHALRRSFEKLLRRADVDGLVRRSLAGWASAKAQSIYTDVDAKDRADALGSVIRLLQGSDADETDEPES